MTESFSSVLIASHMVPQRDRYECISRKCIRIYIKVEKETNVFTTTGGHAYIL